MEISEENGITDIKLVDINELIPEKPKKKGRKKKVTTEPVAEPAAEPISEKEKLKQELLRLSDYNPEIVTKPVNDKISNLVNEMDLNELRARVREGHRSQSSKMDDSVANQAINLANQLTGRMLGCLEELNESSLQDKLLKECVKDYMCLNILDFIPNELKIGGLYGSHVASAYYKASAKKPKLTELTDDQKAKLNELKGKLTNVCKDNTN